MTSEELQEQLLQLQEKQKKIEEDNKLLQKTLQEKEQREKELIEHNQKLFLRVTSKKEEQEEQEEQEIPFCLDEETYKLLSERDIKELNELIEGDE